MKIKLTLLSDLCTSSGESIAGIIDIDSVYDEYGLPYIPARRFKGVLRDAALELLDFNNSPYTMDDIDQLFGESGQFHFNSISLGNGYLKNYEKLIEEIKALQQSPVYKRYYRSPFMIDYFSTERSQTTIDRYTRTAKPHSLRRTRFVKRGLDFFFDVTVNDDHQKQFLKDICRNVRHMGLNRTRGLGEVRCQLIDETENTWVKAKVNIQEGQHLKLTYRLKTQMILPSDEDQEVSVDYLPGSALLGAFAGLYLSAHQIGDDAHLDPDFQRLFLSDLTRFNTAYIADDNGQSYEPVSLSYYCVKDGKKIYDRAVVSQVQEQVKGLSNIYVRVEGDRIYKLEPQKKIEYHHQRPESEMIGHAVEEDGVFFQYDTLSNDQRFIGTIEGSKEDLETILSLIPEDGIIYLGRSKTAQYGQVIIESIESVTPQHEQLLVQPGETFVVVLQAPMILLNDDAVVMPDVNLLAQEIQKELGTKAIKLVNHFTKYTKVTGFNRKWKLPKIQYPALEKGTTLVIRNDHTEPISIASINGKHFGLKQNEGYGRVKIEKRKIGELMLSQEPKIEKSVEPQYSKEILEAIQQEIVQKEIEFVAYRQKLPSRRGLNASTINELLNHLDRSNTYEEFFGIVVDIKMMVKRANVARVLTNKSFQNYDKHLEDTEQLIYLAKSYLGLVIKDQLNEAKRIPNQELLKSLQRNEFSWYKIYIRVILERIKFAFRGEKDE